MANNKIKVDVKVDDNGSLQQVGRDAKNASEKLDSLSKGSRTADRNIKGVGQQSSNSTKNFSKMAQGIDGFLVPAYATLAAQLFAVSAAFQFLKNAGDLKQLEAGQLAYTSATGVAMKSLTNDIIAATGAQVNFTDAAQAAAIGTAAGLDTTQLTALGKAAKDASAILGRDVTDSFNRLVRGVTKAEPELLDELGIILRLNDATKEYADTLGVSKDSLTTYQKSQAVVNNVLAQTEAKYSRILAITGDGGANQFAQLGKAFNDVLRDVQKITAYLAGPLAQVLTDTPALAFAAFGLLLKGPLSAIGVNFDDMAKKARRSARVQIVAAGKAQKAYKMQNMTVEKASTALQQQASIAKNQLGPNASKTVLAAAKGVGEMTPQGRATLKRSLKAAQKHVNEHGIVVKGIFTGMSRDSVLAYKAALKQMDIAEQAKVTKTKVAVTKMQATYASLAATARATGAVIMTMATKALAVLGWIGIAYTIFEVLRTSFGLFEKIPGKFDKLVERLQSLKEEYKDFLEVQKELLTGEGLKIDATTGYGNVSSLITSIDQKMIKDTLGLYREANTIIEKNTALKEQEAQQLKDAQGSITGTFAQVSRARSMNTSNLPTELTEAQALAKFTFDKQIKAIEQVRDATKMNSSVFDDYIKALKTGTKVDIARARDAVAELGTQLKSIEKANKAATEQTDNFFKSFAPANQAEQTIKTLAAEIKLLEKKEINEILSPEQLKRLKEAELTLARITAINSAQRAIERERVALSNKQFKISRNLSPLQKQYTDNLFQQRSVELDKQSLQQAELNIINSIKEKDGEITIEQENQLSLIQLQKQALDNKLQGLQDELGLLHQMGKASKAAFESSVTSGLQDLITGKNSSFTAAVGKIAEDTLTAVAGKLSEKMSKSITDFIFGSSEATMAAAITTAHAEGAAVVAQAIVAAHSGKIVADTPTGVVDNLTNGPEGKKGSSMFSKVGSMFSGISDYLFGTTGSSVSSSDGKLLNSVENDKIPTGVFTEFTSDLKGLFSGDAPFLEGLGNVFSSGLSGFDTILGDIARGIFGSDNILGSSTGLFSSLFGAVAGARYGGVLEGYASGGIAKGSQKGFPAVLHGTEAVVPLPNGKQIPVEMRNGNAGTNNVVVNVSVDNQGNAQTSTESQSSQDAGKLGQLVSQAVQRELQNQKRSGGILNPYGAS